MKTVVLVEQQDCERKLRVANHQSVCGCNLQLEILREKVIWLIIILTPPLYIQDFLYKFELMFFFSFF